MKKYWRRVKKKIAKQKWLSSFCLKMTAIKKNGMSNTILWSSLLVIGMIILILFALHVTTQTITSDLQENVQDILSGKEYRHPLTGELMEDELEILPRVFGVMVENAADAWPLIGIDKAFFVIEAPVEGNIPRFLAFFSDEQEVEKIGPVRSARPYYLDWNAALDAVYVHVGGSPQALDLIAKLYQKIDLNQFWQSEYFYRDEITRFAPHNVYTTSDLLISALEELQLDDPEYDSWLYKDEKIGDARQSIAVDFAPGSLYDVEWEYLEEENRYQRWQGNEEMLMQDGAEVFADNIFIMETSVTSIDDVDRKYIETIGRGEGMLIQDGAIILCEWKKSSSDERIRFFTKDGEEVKLNPGITWMQVVTSLNKITVIDAEE